MWQDLLVACRDHLGILNVDVAVVEVPQIAGHPG